MDNLKRLEFKMGTGLRHEAVPISVLRLYGAPEAFESKAGKVLPPKIEVKIFGRIGQDFIVVDAGTDEILGSFPFARDASDGDQKVANAKAIAFADTLGRVWADLGECNVFDPASHRWWCRWVRQDDMPVSLNLDAMAANYGILP